MRLVKGLFQDHAQAYPRVKHNHLFILRGIKQLRKAVAFQAQPWEALGD